MNPEVDDQDAPAVPPFTCGTCNKAYSDPMAAISCCAGS